MWGLTPDRQSLVDLCNVHSISHLDSLTLRRTRRPERVPSKHRAPLRTNINPPVLLQPLKHLSARSNTRLARVVVNVDTLAAHTVMRHDHLRLLVDRDLTPIVLLPRVVRTFNNDVGAELDHIHLLAIKARGHVVKGGLGGDEEGRAVLELDAPFLGLEAHELFNLFAEERDVLLEKGCERVGFEGLHVLENNGALVLGTDVDEDDVVAEAFGKPLAVLLAHVECIGGAAVHVHVEVVEFLGVRYKRNRNGFGLLFISICTVGNFDDSVVCAIVLELLDELRHVREVTNGHVFPGPVILPLQ